MGKVLRAGPTALTTASANILQGGGGDAAMRDRIKNIHVANKTSNPVTFSAFIGATTGSAAGTELYLGKSIPANDAIDFPCDRALASTEYLTALAQANVSLTITVDYEREVV